VNRGYLMVQPLGPLPGLMVRREVATLICGRPPWRQAGRSAALVAKRFAAWRLCRKTDDDDADAVYDEMDRLDG
jgi:hypothetical protein